jgi:metal-responsive CopG/Arc/MetJ family transcriptional regulator
MVAKYMSVSLPKAFIEKIDEVIENTELGYKSRPEFIKDAVRRHLEQYGNLSDLPEEDESKESRASQK